MREFLKDPDAVLDYVFNWGEWLANGEEIVTSTFYIDGVLSSTVPWTIALVPDSTAVTLLTATIWLSGGTLGERYTITNRIVTDQGRTDDRSAVVRVSDR